MSRSDPETGGAPPVAEGDSVRAERMAELGTAFRHAFRSLRSLRGRDTHLKAGELGHAQFELLLELFERGPLSVRELSAAATLSPATVSPMLDYLAENGYVERERSTADRRVVVTKLTRRGRTRVERQKARWRERWTDALADVDPEELRIAAHVLRRIGTIFNEPPKGS